MLSINILHDSINFVIVYNVPACYLTYNDGSISILYSIGGGGDSSGSDCGYHCGYLDVREVAEDYNCKYSVYPEVKG